MRKLATIATLVLLAIGPVPVWADAIHGACPPEHGDMTMQAAGCCSKSCCISPAPIQAGHASSSSLRVKATGAVAIIQTALDARTDAGSPREIRAHGASPAASQTTPVLRC